MAQVERLVGIGRRVLYHHQRRLLGHGLFAEALVAIDIIEQSHPSLGGYHQVEETLYHVETRHVVTVGNQIFAYLLRSVFGLLLRQLQKGKDHQCEVPLKVGLGFLQLYHRLGYVLSVKGIDGSLYRLVYAVLYLHDVDKYSNYIINNGAKVQINIDTWRIRVYKSHIFLAFRGGGSVRCAHPDLASATAEGTSRRHRAPFRAPPAADGARGRHPRFQAVASHPVLCCRYPISHHL